MPAHEVNFDGLVGPTHNYAGLSVGNVASMSHGGGTSHPRAAALQGLAKMKFLADRGLPQAVLPPQERPSIPMLRALGFSGNNDAAILGLAARQAPEILAACSSASSMWVANAATVTPSTDAADGRVHCTPANLVAKFHRSIEPPQTQRTLKAIFHDKTRFAVHDPLPGGQALGDEGAANHTRFAATHAQPGLHFFVHGHRTFDSNPAGTPRKFPSRQSFEAFDAIRRHHQLPESSAVFAQQSPEVIDAGVFHNDVISVGNENVFLYHENAFVQTPAVIDELRRKFGGVSSEIDFVPIEVPRDRVSLTDAVSSYLFNSQLVTVAPGRMALISPANCAQTPSVKAYIEELIAEGHTPLREVHYFDLKQSMHNGGGPACLRLRVVLNDTELAALPPGVRLTDENYVALVSWVNQHYREQIAAADLADPLLLDESRRALDQLTQLLGLGSIYPFQL
jgi:succinylarginine dihydrolase